LLHFAKTESPLPWRFQGYLLSRKAAWYWISVIFAFVTAAVVSAVPENIYPAVYVRSGLAVASVLFLPGYAVVKTLFPGEVPFKIDSEYTSGVERVALSFGMSLALVPIVALLLNFSPWGIRLAPFTFSLLAFTVRLRLPQFTGNTEPRLKGKRDLLCLPE
jgi:uncharacterized membrane protein